jgi:putative ABC transport system permease protein
VTTWALVALSILTSMPFVYLGAAKPDLRSLAFRTTVKRPGQTALVLAGIVIATAAVTSAGVVGDSLRTSVRRSAVTQLGPVDEEVLTSGIASGRAVESALSRSPVGRDVATLPLLSLSTTVVGRDFVARVAQAEILEVDFARAARFGGNAAAAGISGSTPSANHAVISADLAASTSILPGHRMTVEAYGVSRTFTIDRVVPRLGVAGLAAVGQHFGSVSLNLFVPPGTIESMLAEGHGAAGQAPPVSVLAISNGNRPYDPGESQLVTARLRAATAGLPVQVQPVKQLLLADADARASRFTALFRAFGLFSVLGGVLLLVLTVLILARDRARSMGILRANGLRRSRHVAALSLEGWLYSITGAAIGGLVGLGIGALVVLVARDVFATQSAGGVELVFAARPTSVATGCAVGFLSSLVVVVAAAVAASRRNIVRMIKALADPPRALDAPFRRPLGAGFVVAGLAALVGGLVASNGVASVIGPAIAGVGVVLLVADPARTRRAASVVAGAVFIWSSLVVTVVHGAFAGLGVALIATEGSVMVASAVALVTLNHAAITHRWADPPRRALSFGVGLAYSRTAPKRTALIVSMYALAIFTLALLVTIGQLYSHNVDAVAHRLGGVAALEVTSDATRPVPAPDVAQMPGVTHVTTTRSITAQLQDGPATAPIPVALVGFDDSFIGHGSPPVVDGSGDSLFGQVARDPTKVIVGADLQADLPSGLPGTSLHVGDRVEVRDPLTGAARTFTVAGLAIQARWDGVDHVYAARGVADELGGGTAPANLMYVETVTGTNNDVVSAIIDGTHLPNGAYARSFRTLAADTLSTQRQFLDIGAGYATVGLLADLAGIAVLMVDRVRERRRQIATMRALGFRGRTLSRAFRVEAVVIAGEGLVVGLITGSILAWRLGSGGELGQHLSFSMPIGALTAIAVAVVVASIVATSVPTRHAGRLHPAGALRSDE